MKASFDNADKDQDGRPQEFIEFNEENNKIRNDGDNTNFTEEEFAQMYNVNNAISEGDGITKVDMDTNLVAHTRYLKECKALA